MAIFTARGYQSTDLNGSRAAARGVMEVPNFSATYELPYLGVGTITHLSLNGMLEFFNGAWCSGARIFVSAQPDRPAVSPAMNLNAQPYLGFGVSPNSIQRGPFYPPQNSWQTIARGKLWLGIGPVVKKLPARVVVGAPPFPDQLAGRVSWRRQRPEDYVPNALAVVFPRIAAPIPPYPDYLSGRIRRRLGHPPDILPIPFLVFSPRVVSPVPPYPDHTLGRVRRRAHYPKDYVPNPHFLTAQRWATSVPPWPDRLNGRTLRFQPRNVTELFARETALLQSLSARCSRESSFQQLLRARGGAILAQAQDLNAFARAGYRLFALNLESKVETEIGFAATDAAPAISGVSLVNGAYEIHVRAFGHWWQHARLGTIFPITIENGEAIKPLPTILNLSYSIDGEIVYLSWSWQLTAGFHIPDDFAVWAASSDLIDTSDEPAVIVQASAPGTITTVIALRTELHFAAICSRRGIAKGPLTTIFIGPTSTPIDSPTNLSVSFLKMTGENQ